MTLRSDAAEIVFDHVTKRYGGSDRPAVDDLSLTIPAGEICVLIGPSGGGKTTAMKLVNRLITLTDGDITIDGTSVMKMDPVELRRGIGYVIQQIGLFPHMTIEANVATVPKLVGWDKARTRERARELLDLVGLDSGEYATRYPAQLSGGQRQRVGLARAMAADPPLMLMDEPFGAIDPITRERLQNDFLRLHREVRKTVIFVTHDIDEAIKMGDRICILRQGGKLAQYDTPEAILASPADEFVADFVGADRGLKRLGLRTLADVTLADSAGPNGQRPEAASDMTLRDALSLMLTEGSTELAVRDADGDARGYPPPGARPPRRRRRRARLPPPRGAQPPARRGQRRGGSMSALAAVPVAQSGPVIPNFGRGDDCIRNNGKFCLHWFLDNFDSRFLPRVGEHLKMTAIAIVIGFVLAFGAALIAHRHPRFELPFANVAALFYTVPSIAFFQIMVPITGIGWTSIEIALVSYTLLILFRNILTGLRGVPEDVKEAAEGMGLTPRQTLYRVELPL